MKKILVLSATAVMSISCIGGYENINRNPYGVTDKEMQRDGYAVKAALIGIANGVVSPDVNTTQFTEVLLGCDLAGYTAPGKDKSGWDGTIANFNPPDNWTNVLMKSSHIIPRIYSNYRTLHQVTEDPVILAVGDIIKVAAMHRVTDTYGPIPYSKIGQNGEINVPYDTQEQVYRKMFEELTNAVDVLTPVRVNNFPATTDVIYGGNIEKWIRFANSLKLRLALRVSYAAPELAEQMAKEAVEHEVGVMKANGDNAKFSSWGTKGNPFKVSVEYNMVTEHDDKTVCGTHGGDSHAAADIICYMNGFNDPRRAVYFTRSEFEGKDYVGMRRCVVVPNNALAGHKFSGANIGTEDPAYWMTASETAFLEAEAVAVFGWQLVTSGGEVVTAGEAYNRGVRLSFEQRGCGGVEQYLADATSTPSSYNAEGMESGTTGSMITVAWNDGDSNENKQERIITQKWIANWLLGNESWADWRRTGYPRLLPGTANGNYSGGKVDNVTGMRRMKYPSDEGASNKTNYDKAVEALLQENSLNTSSGDEFSVRLWFDCKPGNPTYNGK